MSLFQKIIDREIPAEIVFENDEVLAFKDIHPQAAIHLLFVHKQATTNVGQLVSESPNQITALFKAITNYAKEQKLDESGYRVVTNIGQHGGQTVFHTHFHLLAGEQLGSFGK